MYYYPSAPSYPTDQIYPVPTFIRTWLVFCIHGNAHIIHENINSSIPQVAFKGPFDGPYFFSYTQSKVAAVIIQFSVTGLHDLTGIDVSKFKNSYPDAKVVWSKTVLAHTLEELTNTESANERIAIIDQFFIDLLGKQSLGVSERSIVVKEAIGLTRENDFKLSLGAICDELSISVKTLERAFKIVTGITPKRYFAGCLFENLGRELITKKDKRISEIMSSPFYDFSHINKWFGRYANLSPSTFNQQDYHLLEEIIKHQNQYDSK